MWLRPLVIGLYHEPISIHCVIKVILQVKTHSRQQQRFVTLRISKQSIAT
ncbi:Uncharacterised protein [Vibrio cholerae]|nr:Uncharacterised protein [Vibrio cholerae]